MILPRVHGMLNFTCKCLNTWNDARQKIFQGKCDRIAIGLRPFRLWKSGGSSENNLSTQPQYNNNNPF